MYDLWQYQPSAMTIREVEEASAADEELSAVRQCINNNNNNLYLHLFLL